MFKVLMAVYVAGISLVGTGTALTMFEDKVPVPLDRVVISVLFVEASAIDESKLEDIIAFCNDKQITATRQQDAVKFSGPREDLIHLADFIFNRVEKL